MRAFTATLLMVLVALGGCLDLGGGQRGIEPTDYIQAHDYTKWVIEIDYVQGQQPRDSALTALQDRLEDLVRKERITVKLGDAIPGKAVWSDADVQSTSERYLNGETGDDTVVTHVLYLDGEYGRNRNVLGVAYGYGLISIFKQRIDDGCSVATLCVGNAGTVETAVLVHEFGHILGLVDRGIEMVNDHSDGGKHSSNRNSVMYASVENTGIFGLSNIPTRFDSNDRLDVCNAGGQGSC